MQHVPEGFYHEKKAVGVAVATDLDDGKPGAYDLPTPSKAGVVPASPAVKDKDGNVVTNGALTLDEKEQWVERTGWAPRFGNGDPKDDEGPSLLDHETWLEGKIEDKFFGGKYNSSSLYRSLLHHDCRLVSQCGSNHICMSRIMVRGSDWGWFGMGLPCHGCLWDILSNLAPPCATKLPGRCESRDGQENV